MIRAGRRATTSRRNCSDDPLDGLRGARRAPLLAAALLPLLAFLGAAAAGGPESSHPAAGSEAAASATQPAPPAHAEEIILEGVLKPMQIIGVTPEWRENLVSYEPDNAVVERIRAITSKRRSELKVEVVIGTWCGDSRREVPHFMKVQQRLSEDRLPVTFMGVDRTKQHPPEAVEGRDVHRVPTFIVYHEGREIGRIVEKPEVSIEADLEKILARLN